MKDKKNLESVRLDRWLNAARFYKTRSNAAKACDGRKVKVNGITAKPHKFLQTGDKLTIHHLNRYRNIEVIALADRGLPAKEAQLLYHEEIIEQSPEQQKTIHLIKEFEKRHNPKTKGRPTKRERRQLEKWKGI